MKRRMKSSEKKSRNNLTQRLTTWHGRAQWHGRTTQHGQAVPLFWPAGRAGLLVHGSAP